MLRAEGLGSWHVTIGLLMVAYLMFDKPLRPLPVRLCDRPFDWTDHRLCLCLCPGMTVTLPPDFTLNVRVHWEISREGTSRCGHALRRSTCTRSVGACGPSPRRTSQSSGLSDLTIT